MASPNLWKWTISLARKEADRVGHLGILYQPQDIIVGAAGFLLRCQILKEIRQGVSLRLKFAGVKGNAGRRPGAEMPAVWST